MFSPEVSSFEAFSLVFISLSEVLETSSSDFFTLRRRRFGFSSETGVSSVLLSGVITFSAVLDSELFDRLLVRRGLGVSSGASLGQDVFPLTSVAAIKLSPIESID